MNSCVQCAATLPERTGRGRPAKFCSQTCNRAYFRTNNKRTCEAPDCGKPHRAQGFCATHYNQTLPNRYKKTVQTCAACTTSEWIPPFTRNTGTCEWCGHPNPRSRAASYCSPPCKKKAKRVRRTGREHDTPGVYSWAQVVRLWVGMGKRCAYCNNRTLLCDIQAEHVIPLSRGGENHIGNILPSCGPCNADKRDLYLHEWNADRTRRGLQPVRTSWSDTDPRFAHLRRTPVRLSA